jgi:prepilin-type N-terminal cleavage/methylation domain-containing protein
MQKNGFRPIDQGQSAFTMTELILVIIILGIVSSIGAEIIAKVYENYIVQRAQHRASLKTQLALNQTINRLRYAIPGTIVKRVTISSTAEPVSNSTSGGDYDVLQWVARDGDSFEAISSDTNRKPGWSGFCDIDNSTKTTISTPGSNLNLANTIIGNLSNSTKSITDAFIYFAWDDLNDSHQISGASGESITLVDNNASHIVERYYLAWTSYALVMEGNDLYLYYNFSPTYAAPIPSNPTKALLLKNVTNFKFIGQGQTTRLKICIDQNISATTTIPSCKEKAVF